MKKFVVLIGFAIILAASFSLIGCGFRMAIFDERAVVNFSGSEYTVYYEVREEKGEINWYEHQTQIIKYKIRDSATRNSKFYIYAETVNGKLMHAFPMYFYELAEGSFLQEIVVENDIIAGRDIFKNIINQIEKTRLGQENQ